MGAGGVYQAASRNNQDQQRRRCKPFQRHVPSLLSPHTPKDVTYHERRRCKPFQPHAPRLDLSRAPYNLYGVKYIDPVSLANLFNAMYRALNLTWVVRPMFCMMLRASIVSRLKIDLGRAPYVLYGVKYIDLVPRPPIFPFFLIPFQRHVPRLCHPIFPICLPRLFL